MRDLLYGDLLASKQSVGADGSGSLNGRSNQPRNTMRPKRLKNQKQTLPDNKCIVVVMLMVGKDIDRFIGWSLQS